MIRVRPATERGRTDWGWLDSRHTFSFGEYHDPGHEGFRSLRVINDDRVQAGKGFGTHGHRDMEILSYVLEGALEHKDSAGGGGVIRPGEIQFMRAGTGVMHSEFNHSGTEPVHFLQVWIIPDRRGLAPAYGQLHFDRAAAARGLVLLAARDGGLGAESRRDVSPQGPRDGIHSRRVPPEGRAGSLQVQQDVDLWVTLLAAGDRRELALRPGRHAWVHVARGRATLDGTALGEGDGAAVSEQAALHLAGEGPAEILVFDLA